MTMVSQLNESIISYLRDVDTIFQNGFESDELKQLFLNNVFSEIAENEFKLFVKKSTSVILEKLISSASTEHLLQLLEVCEKNLDELLCSTCGCHVFQHCLRRLILLLNTSDVEASPWKKLIDTVLSCCRFSKNDIDLVLWLTESSQAFRYLIAALGGSSEVLNSKKNKFNDQTESQEISCEITITDKKLPQQFVEAFEKVVLRFVGLERIKIVELLNNDKAAPCICCMLRVASLRSSLSLDALCNKLLAICQKNETDDWSTFTILMKDRIASHIIDSLLESDHRPTNLKLMNILTLSDHLVELACHDVANFVVQKLIVKSVSFDQFDSIFKSLIIGLEDILAAEKYGVVQKLAEQSVHVKSCQKALLEALLQTFHCFDEQQSNFIASLIASYTTYDMFFSPDKSKIPPLQTITYHGSLLLQTLFTFDDPFIVSNSLIHLPIDHVVKMACHVSGSHIIDSFFNSATIKDKTKIKFISHFRDQFNVFARDKYGNKVLWNMWTRSNVSMKITIAESLVGYEDLKSHPYGKYVLIHFRMRDFVGKRENWNKFQLQQQKKRQMFDEFLNTDKCASQKKSKKRH